MSSWLLTNGSFGHSPTCVLRRYADGFTTVSDWVTVATLVVVGGSGCPPGPHSLGKGAPFARALVPASWSVCDSLKMRLSVPFQDQYDNASGQGWRECFTSSVAMLLIYRRAVSSDDAYAKIRSRCGDSTSAAAHLTACKALGQEAVFSQRFSRLQLQQQITSLNPVAVGWLHRGSVLSPQPGGHWSVCIGINAEGVFMHDPAGEARLIGGGHISGRSGSQVFYSWKNWGPRWEVEGPGSGWAFYLNTSGIGRPAA